MSESEKSLLKDVRIALTFYREWMREHGNLPGQHDTSYPFGVEVETRIREMVK